MLNKQIFKVSILFFLPFYTSGFEILPQENWSTALAPDFNIRAIEADPLYEIDKVYSEIPNTNNEVIVIHYCYKDSSDISRDGIQILYTTTESLFEVENIPYPWRPIETPYWTEDGYLAFVRWSNPHYGMIYIISAYEYKLVHAQPINDFE